MILNELFTRYMTFTSSVSYLCMGKKRLRELFILGIQYHIYVKCPPAISGLARPLMFDLQVTIKFLAHCCAVDGFTFRNPCYLEVVFCELSQRCTP